jgi:anti-sigma regulatory factor (Ser/Thr protein kinase)
VSVPAHTAMVPAVRAAVGASVRLMGVGAPVVAALRRVTEELATNLIEYAAPLAQLDVEVVHDEEDIYLRMRVDRAARSAISRSSGLLRLLLSGSIDSVEVGAEGDGVYGVVQVAIA